MSNTTHRRDTNHPDFPHGELAGYRAGCKCELCNSANNVYSLENYYKRNPKKDRTSKICKRCKIEKSIEEYYLHSLGKWPEPNCIPCTAIVKREYRLMKQYGLTVEKYDELLFLQNGKCAICLLDFSEMKNPPHIDHDHTTGEVRGLLCSKCNPAIGLLQDDYKLCLNAAKYLKR